MSEHTDKADAVAGGQRRINLLWETVQAVIAISVTWTAMVVAGRLALLTANADATERQISVALSALLVVSNTLGLIIGFYFGRVNHQRVGGAGHVPHGQTRGLP